MDEIMNKYFKERIKPIRDKKRIKPFMKELTKFWEANQDLRFGQVVYILADKLEASDIFFPEEDKWMKALNELNNKKGSD